MSDKVVDFPTTADEDLPVNGPTEGPTPDELKAMAVKGGPQVLQLIQKNRKVSHETLQRIVENLEKQITDIRRNLPDEPLMVKKTDRGDTFFSLEQALRDVQVGLGALLTNMEAMNSLVDMITHDLVGSVRNLNQTQRAMLMANSHVQTLLELLKEKGVVSEPELKDMWERLVEMKKQEIKQERPTEFDPQ